MDKAEAFKSYVLSFMVCSWLYFTILNHMLPISLIKVPLSQHFIGDQKAKRITIERQEIHPPRSYITTIYNMKLYQKR